MKKVRLVKRDYATGKTEYIFYLRWLWVFWCRADSIDNDLPCVFNTEAEARTYLPYYPKTYKETDITNR
ncbi:hypothetical protein [Formosa sp. S-31]|uniref:hypothetical protein n=1 Tax=Formosa sp. S-31 TaxID=2790949 RepID=UPI003EBA9095